MAPPDPSGSLADAGRVVERVQTEPALPGQKGSSGVVRPAVDPETGRRLALKVVDGPVGQDPAVREDALSDAAAQAALDHPRIAAMVEHGALPTGFYLLMSWLPGDPLDAVLRDEPLDPQTALRVAHDVADALEEAQSHGIAHRDLTPAKIIVGEDGRARIGDLGAGRRRAGDPLPAASLDYVAPEIVRGGMPGPASQEYALACILFHAMAGEPPFAAARGTAKAQEHLLAPRPLASERRPGLPPELDPVLARGMAIIPGERHGTPLALVEAVGAVVARGGVGGHARTPWRTRRREERAREGRQGTTAGGGRGRPGRAGTRRRSRALLWVALALVVGAAGIAGGLRAGREVKEPPPPPAAPGTVSTSEMALVRPTGWRTLDPAPSVPWLDPAEQIAIGPPDAAKGTAILAGMTEPGRDGLLPDALLDRLPRAPGRGDPVRLGRLQAVRFPRLDVRGVPGSPIRLYAVATSVGTATVACTGAAATELAATCDERAATLRLVGPAPRPVPTPPGAYARTVERTFAALNAKRRAGLAKLASARTRGQQAVAARRLAEACRTAGARLAKAPDRRRVEPGSQELVTAVAVTANAYGDMARAAAAGDATGYADARTQAVAAEGRVQRALDLLEDSGYDVR